MISALLPNRRTSGVRVSRAPWVELVFVCVLCHAHGCVHPLHDCPPPVLGGGAGCLQEDLCICDPATGVLPPPQCMLMMQASRVRIIEPVEAKRPQPSAVGPTVAAPADVIPHAAAEQSVAKVAPQPTSRQPIETPASPPLPSQAPLVVVEDAQPPAASEAVVAPKSSDPFAEVITELADALPDTLADSIADDEAVNEVPTVAEIAPLAETSSAADAPRIGEPPALAEAPPVAVPEPVLAQAAPRLDLDEPHKDVQFPPAPRPAPVKINHVSRAVITDLDALPAKAPRPPDIILSADEPELPPAPRPAPLKPSGNASVKSSDWSSRH